MPMFPLPYAHWAPNGSPGSFGEAKEMTWPVVEVRQVRDVGGERDVRRGVVGDVDRVLVVVPVAQVEAHGVVPDAGGALLHEGDLTQLTNRQTAGTRDE
ncbi:hypothetical protein [Kitasatospora griseola]|uniref:hypothetical protein n=1 Tax=Kitasatospora griseola TaxID=2064 RepID=UPI00380D57B5